MKPTTRSANIVINQSALSHNATVLQQYLSPHVKMLAMVKADAYGHGVATTCDGLWSKVDGFGVATLQEGLAVHQVNQRRKLVVLIEGVFSLDEWQMALHHDFACVVHSPEQLAWVLENPPKPDSYSNTIWLKYNTGMNRLGFDKQSCQNASEALIKKGYRIMLTSHFACADDRENPCNAMQIERFDELYQELKNRYGDRILGSLCNSAGIINFPNAHFDWVRAGIGLYGGSPVVDKSANALRLQPVMTFFAHIMATHDLQAGDKVGYGGLWVADSPCRIGVVSVGYGDGYPRVVDGANVLILNEKNQYFAPIIGRVAMDMLMIDIDGLDVKIGDKVVLWGNGLPADDVATWANTISYELFCRTTNRPKRQIV